VREGEDENENVIETIAKNFEEKNPKNENENENENNHQKIDPQKNREKRVLQCPLIINSSVTMKTNDEKLLTHDAQRVLASNNNLSTFLYGKVNLGVVQHNDEEVVEVNVVDEDGVE
jgi:hypothetical protein